MVNGNYHLYEDKSSPELEIVDDHVQTMTAERRSKRKVNRSANELQNSLICLSIPQRDNETDSIKCEKKVKEPRLLRYVPNTAVEEHFITEKFETYDLKPNNEIPKRGYMKKPKNPADGSSNYAYSRSNSSSPNGNLPTISEHGDVDVSRGVKDNISGYETKLDRYFTKPRDLQKISSNAIYRGSNPDSLYRVSTTENAVVSKMARALRLMRWPAALIVVCIALAVFVYYLMPDNLQASNENSTYWEENMASASVAGNSGFIRKEKINRTTTLPITGPNPQKPKEIDFYGTENEKPIDLVPISLENVKVSKKKPPIPPVFPARISPEVQYGNEKADDSLRSKQKDSFSSINDSTLRPHITQNPEKPLAIYFVKTPTTESLNKAESINDFLLFADKAVIQKKDVPKRNNQKDSLPIETRLKPNVNNKETRIDPKITQNHSDQFTSGHSKLFGIGIEDAEKMSSTTQSALYNTRVSPTLPTWRDHDDVTTKKYPINAATDVQCHTPRIEMCRGVLPYDLAGDGPTELGGVNINSLMIHLNYLMESNCSKRLTQFICTQLEPECSPDPESVKMPCSKFCRAIVEQCEGLIPVDLYTLFKCELYPSKDCIDPRSPCLAGEVPCLDGTCILHDWLCDGSKECPNGEDEQRCNTCDKHQFQCLTGICIPKEWQCDGYSDCHEGEDEMRCLSRAAREQVKDKVGDAARHDELAVGSAPAPSVRVPGRLPTRNKGFRTASVVDSSKELLIASDSNSNALKRNFSRRPLPSRLIPYKPMSLTKTTTIEPATTKVVKTTTMLSEMDTEVVEDMHLYDLEYFEELNKQMNSANIKPPPPEPLSAIAKNDATVPTKTPSEKQRESKASRPNKDNEKEYGYKNYGSVSAHVSPCPSNELRCVDGRCITLDQLCDGTIDCTDHSDEDNCFT